MYNNKITFLVALLLIIIPFSCSKSVKHENHIDKQAELLSQLSSYNKNFIAKHVATKGKNVVVVALADAQGAWSGGKAGFKIGGRIGSMLGSPHYGAATGALAGGLLWGAFQSYLAYEPEGYQMSFEEFYQIALPIAAVSLIERNDYSTEVYVAALDSITINSEGNLVPSEQIDLVDEFREKEVVGIGHNYALDMAIEKKECAFEIKSQIQDKLSDIDKEILLSQEFFNAFYDELTNSQEQAVTSSEAVFNSFMEIYSVCNEDDVLEIANAYVEMISTSQALSKDEESNIYSALSVAVNTAHYWSHRQN